MQDPDFYGEDEEDEEDGDDFTLKRREAGDFSAEEILFHAEAKKAKKTTTTTTFYSGPTTTAPWQGTSVAKSFLNSSGIKVGDIAQAGIDIRGRVVGEEGSGILTLDVEGEKISFAPKDLSLAKKRSALSRGSICEFFAAGEWRSGGRILRKKGNVFLVSHSQGSSSFPMEKVRSPLLLKKKWGKDKGTDFFGLLQSESKDVKYKRRELIFLGKEANKDKSRMMSTTFCKSVWNKSRARFQGGRCRCKQEGHFDLRAHFRNQLRVPVCTFDRVCDCVGKKPGFKKVCGRYHTLLVSPCSCKAEDTLLCTCPRRLETKREFALRFGAGASSSRAAGNPWQFQYDKYVPAEKKMEDQVWASKTILRKKGYKPTSFPPNKLRPAPAWKKKRDLVLAPCKGGKVKSLLIGTHERKNAVKTARKKTVEEMREHVLLMETVKPKMSETEQAKILEREKRIQKVEEERAERKRMVLEAKCDTSFDLFGEEEEEEDFE